MEKEELTAVLDAMLKSQQMAEETLLKALGFGNHMEQSQQAILPVIIDEEQMDQPKFFPGVEFDEAMESPELWPVPDVIKLSDLPRRTQTVGEIE